MGPRITFKQASQVILRFKNCQVRDSDLSKSEDRCDISRIVSCHDPLPQWRVRNPGPKKGWSHQGKHLDWSIRGCSRWAKWRSTSYLTSLWSNHGVSMLRPGPACAQLSFGTSQKYWWERACRGGRALEVLSPKVSTSLDRPTPGSRLSMTEPTQHSGLYGSNNLNNFYYKRKKRPKGIPLAGGY